LGDTLTIEALPYGYVKPPQGLQSYTTIVLADGSVTLPYLGQVPAAGTSLDALRADIKSRYERHFGSSVVVFLSFAATNK
jgi:protein involved in polysaccharide export with SLBB domain